MADLLDVRPVVLITGVSAAGKSTVAELLARRFDRGVHVRGDVFRRMVVSGRHEMTSEPTDEAWSQLRLRYRLGATTADAYHDAGFAVVVQDVVIGRSPARDGGPVLAEYVAAIRSRPLVVVVLAPRVEIVAEREAGRAKTAYSPEYDSIEALDRALREEPRIGWWLDNSDQEPAETVDTIIERGLDLGAVHR